ncbi:MAG: flippase [Thermodesulfobacteriota bacterium]
MKNVIIKNTSALFVGALFENLLSYFLIVFIARYLGDVGLGEYSFIIAFGYSVILLANPGLDYLLLKEISRDRELTVPYISNILSIKIILTLLAVCMTFIGSLFLNKNPLVIRSLWIITLVLGFSGIGNIFNNILQSNEQMGLIALVKVLERAIALALGLFFLSTTHSLFYLTLALFSSGILREAAYIYLTKTYVPRRWGVDLALWKPLFVRSLPYALTSIFMFIYFRTDTVMLSLLINDQVTGWYNAAYRLLDLLTQIPVLFVTAVLPSMSRYSKEDLGALRDLFHYSFRFLVLLVFPIGVGIFILAPRVIFFIYKSGFENAVLTLKILIWAAVFIFMNFLCGNLLNLINKQKIFTGIIGIAALFNIVLNFVLIPRYSYVGAGVATVLSEALIFILMYHFVKKHFIRIPLWEMVWRPTSSSLLMAVIILNLDSLPLWYLVPIGTVSYFLCFALLGGFNKQDRDVVSAIFSMMGPKKG